MLLKKSKLGLIMCMASICLTGCGSELQEQYDQLVSESDLLRAENEGLKTEVNTLKSQLQDVAGVKGGKDDGINEIDTNNKSDNFVNIESKAIKFNETLRYTGMYEAPNSSKIMLSDKVTVNPSNNWVVSMDGTSTKYNHPDGIIGEIKVQSIAEVVDDIFIESDMIQPFLDTLDLRVPAYTNKIYVGDIWSGMCCTALINADNETNSAMLKFGVLGYKDIAIVYCFYYDGEMNSTKTELIDTLVRSMTIDKEQVKVNS